MVWVVDPEDRTVTVYRKPGDGRVLWEELGLPKLKPQSPWFGYSLGEWNQEFDAMAARATAGDYFDNAESLEARRRSDVAMNTEVRRVDEQKPKPAKKARR